MDNIRLTRVDGLNETTYFHENHFGCHDALLRKYFVRSFLPIFICSAFEIRSMGDTCRHFVRVYDKAQRVPISIYYLYSIHTYSKIIFVIHNSYSTVEIVSHFMIQFQGMELNAHKTRRKGEKNKLKENQIKIEYFKVVHAYINFGLCRSNFVQIRNE